MTPAHLKVSVIIPCHHRHFEFLEKLLSAYMSQLEPLDEVVISLSGVEHVPAAQLQRFERRSWPFCLKLIKTVGPKDASDNRNIACLNSTGDLLICQDADDLAHRQRVKVIRYLFEHFEIDLLLHQFELQTFSEQRPIQVEKAPELCFRFNTWYEHEVLSYVQHGCPALMRYVWESVQWEKNPNGLEDTWFNWRVCQQFSHKAILFLPLIAYRPQLGAGS